MEHFTLTVHTGQLQPWYKSAKSIPATRQSGSPLLGPNWKQLHQSHSKQALTQFATHQKRGNTETKEQLETARLHTDSRADYVLQDLFLPHEWWQLQSHNGHFSLTECSLNPKYNFTRGFPRATFAAITYSPLVRHKLHLQNQDHLAGVLPNKHPVRCHFHFVSPAARMDLPFPEDVTRWTGLMASCSGREHKQPHSPVGTQGDFQPWHQLFLF